METKKKKDFTYIYYFVPKMVKYYLGEVCVTHNAPTYLPYY